MKFKLSGLVMVIGLSVSPLSAIAADNAATNNHTAHAGHTANMNQTLAPIMAVPTEGGQGAFTAIAEIVEMLNNDPNTDWSKVDIDALRNHLVDMNELALYAQAAQSEADGVVKFIINGKPSALRAAKNMVPAHAVELNKMDGWQVGVTVEADRVIMLVTADNEATLAKIRALGFFGMMATGAHHQPHHWGMATGAMQGHAHTH